MALAEAIQGFVPSEVLPSRAIKVLAGPSLGVSLTTMNRLLWFACGVVIWIQPAAVHAQATNSRIPGQANPIPPAQSLAPRPSLCSGGAEGLRVCNSDFQSCSSICAASVFDPNADTSACSARCCTSFLSCLSIRQCDTSGINCFTLPGALGTQ
jgi:hypothetical protein